MLSETEWTALTASLVVAARAVAIGLPLAVATAWVLARGRFPGRTLLDALVHAPLVLPPVVVGYALLLTFGVQGPVGRWLEASFGTRLVFSSAGASLSAVVSSALASVVVASSSSPPPQAAANNDSPTKADTTTRPGRRPFRPVRFTFSPFGRSLWTGAVRSG